VRWGNLSFAFWNSTVPGTVRFTLWSWALGDTADQREPHPVINQPIIAATTADGIGIGTALTTLRGRYGSRLVLADDRRSALLHASGASVIVSLAHDIVTGIQSRLAFC
jgi:hypothetical protein